MLIVHGKLIDAPDDRALEQDILGQREIVRTHDGGRAIIPNLGSCTTVGFKIGEAPGDPDMYVISWGPPDKKPLAMLLLDERDIVRLRDQIQSALDAVRSGR